MPRRFLGCAAALLTWSCAAAGQAPTTWVYITSFQSGALVAVDLATEKSVYSIPVTDRTGSIGFAASKDGSKLFVVDGGLDGRVRTFAASTGKELSTREFPNRLANPGGANPAHLTADGRWLLIKTYDYASAAAGVRIFNTESNTFTMIGLRNRSCAAPALGSVPDGTILAACPNLLEELAPLPTLPGDFVVGSQQRPALARPLTVAAAAATGAVYALGCAPDQPPRLVSWNRTAKTMRESELASLLPDARITACQVSLDVAPTGDTLGIVAGTGAWILDGSALRVRQRMALPGPGEGAAFTVDGKHLITAAARDTELYVAPVDGGRVRSIRLSVDAPTAPWMLRSALKPPGDARP